MPTFDYIRERGIADKLITKFGMAAKLRRIVSGSPVDRNCYVVITEYMPKDAASQLANPTDRQVIISAGLGDVPTMPPDFELDQLVTFVQPLGTTPVIDEILPFTMPVKPIRPAGIVVLYQTSVRR